MLTNPKENGKYLACCNMNGIMVKSQIIFRDGEWYLSEISEHPLKEGVVVSYEEPKEK